MNLLLALVGTLLPGAPIADVFVDVNNANCAAGTGTLANPVCSIGDAIALASSGDTIRIAPGTYVENVTLAFDLDLIGTGGASVTIVDGGGAGSVITIDSAVTATIDGLTVTGGLSTVPWTGGGIHADGHLVLRNSTIIGNTGISGGGIFSDNGGLEISDSTISSNSSESGGGVFFQHGYLSITGSTVESNTATGSGGGMEIYDATAIIADSVIRDNTASDWGGGIYAWFFSMRGVNQNSGSLLISGTTISGNSATTGGGLTWAGYCSFSACTFGGRLLNSTVSSNSATGNGGGLYVGPTSHLPITNSTITGNVAGLEGGGIYQPYQPAGYYFPTPRVPLLRTIVAGNSASTMAASDLASSSFVSTYGNNLIGIGAGSLVDGVDGNQVGSVSSPLDPMLGPLQDNGGPSFTHEPLPLSPAIDAGNFVNLVVYATPVFVDQRGRVRPQGLAQDIGAVETEDFSVSFCNGDGGDQMGCSDCPCSNSMPAGSFGGCLNSSGAGAYLVHSGSSSVSLFYNVSNDLRLGVMSVPPGAFCILISGDALAPDSQTNPCFGSGSGVQAVALDGLRCAVVNTRRHGVRRADSSGRVGATNGPWGGEGDPYNGIDDASGGFVAGQTRYFQVIHRDDPLAMCMRGLNTSQASEVVFTP